MYDQLIINKEESVTLCLIWRCNHLFLFFRAELRQIVYHLECVCSVGHAETKLELIRLDALSLEVVSLDHKHVGNRLISHAKFNLQTDGLQGKKIGPEMITYLSNRGVHLLCHLTIEI